MLKYIFFVYLLVLRETEKIEIPCSGLFIMSIMFTTSNSRGPQSLTIRIDDKTVYRFNSGDMVNENRKTITYLQTFKLKIKQIIRIEENNLELKQLGSWTTFSLIKIREIEENLHTVSMLLNGVEMENGEPLIRFERDTLTDFIHNNSTTFAIGSLDESHAHYMTIKKNGIFFVSLDLILEDTTTNLDLTFTLGITTETDNTDIERDSGLACSQRSTSGSATLSLRGTIEMSANSYISLKLHTSNGRNIRIGKNSRLTLTRVSIKNLIALIDTIVKPAKLMASTCIKDTTARLENTHVHGYDLNKYILQNETTLTAPTDGVYFVHFNQTLSPTKSKNQPEMLVLYLTHTRRGRVLNTVKHVVYTKNVLLHRVFSRLIILEKNDRIELWANCDKEIMMRFRIAFAVVSTLTSSNFQVENRNFTDKSFEIQSNEKRMYRVKTKGVYLVLYNILISYSGVTKDQTLTLKIINRKTTVVEQKQYMRPNTIGADGLVSLSCQTFLEIDSTRDSFIFTVLEHDEIASENNSTQIYKVEEHFSYVLLTNPLHQVHGFRMVQSSKKLLETVSGSVEPDNFQLSALNGGFKQPGTQLFGPFLKVTKQMTVYYQVSATLEKVEGWFWLSFRIPPKRGAHPISSKVQINKNDGPVTLQASGLISVYPGESVFFMINSEKNQNIILSHCVWSLMEIKTPEENDYKTFKHHKER